MPATYVAFDFDAGVSADPQGGYGTQRLMLSSMTSGAGGRDAMEIAEQQERLGAMIARAGTLDRCTVTLTTLCANLGLSLDLFADIVHAPRLRGNRNRRARAISSSRPRRRRHAAKRLGEAHISGAGFRPEPSYGRPSSGLGSEGSVAPLTRDDLIAFHQSWIRPETARVFVVSDRPLNEITRALNARFGNWRGGAAAVGRKDSTTPIPAPRSRIVIVDRPQSPQSVIYAGDVLPVRGSDDTLTLNAANEVLGNNFLSRINTEIRERRGWSYGLSGVVNLREYQVPYIINAPVQADRTGDSIRELIAQINAFNSHEWSDRRLSTCARSTATSASCLVRMRPQGPCSARFAPTSFIARPDNYWESVASRYRAMTRRDMDAAARAVIDPSRFIWVVVGDASVVRPQLQGLGLPIEVVQPAN